MLAGGLCTYRGAPPFSSTTPERSSHSADGRTSPDKRPQQAARSGIMAKPPHSSSRGGSLQQETSQERSNVKNTYSTIYHVCNSRKPEACDHVNKLLPHLSACWMLSGFVKPTHPSGLYLKALITWSGAPSN